MSESDKRQTGRSTRMLKHALQSVKEGKRVWIVGASNQHIRYLRGIWQVISGDSGLYPERYYTFFQYETPRTHSGAVEVYKDHYLLELEIKDLEIRLEDMKKEATRWDE